LPPLGNGAVGCAQQAAQCCRATAAIDCDHAGEREEPPEHRNTEQFMLKYVATAWY